MTYTQLMMMHNADKSKYFKVFNHQEIKEKKKRENRLSLADINIED